jgi:hypothetical protein
MKAALFRIFEFLTAYDRRLKKPTDRSYCICGALKSQVERQEGEAPLKAQGRPPGL